VYTILSKKCVCVCARCAQKHAQTCRGAARRRCHRCVQY
jgi:hypothetical protein